MSADIEFDCQECGIHVYGVGRSTVPQSGLCAMCEWLEEFVADPEERMEIRRRIADDGLW